MVKWTTHQLILEVLSSNINLQQKKKWIFCYNMYNAADQFRLFDI